MLLGDAARLIDPFTGEGIGNAMLSGMKSAATAAWCMANNDFSAGTTSSYETDIREKLVPDLETGLKLQHLARKALLLNLVIGKASRNEKIRMAISEMLYDPKAKNQLSRSSFYLKLIFGI
jgi:flavin-dependent dehydrogenase